MEWADGKPTTASITADAGFQQRDVKVVYGGNVVGELSTSEESELTITSF